jgi:hypothetical protein
MNVLSTDLTVSAIELGATMETIVTKVEVFWPRCWQSLGSRMARWEHIRREIQHNEPNHLQGSNSATRFRCPPVVWLEVLLYFTLDEDSYFQTSSLLADLWGGSCCSATGGLDCYKSEQIRFLWDGTLLSSRP